MKVLNQVIVIFILIGVGFFCTKKKWITEVGVKQMTAILLNFVTPCVLIRAYQEKTFQPEVITSPSESRVLRALALFPILRPVWKIFPLFPASGGPSPGCGVG